MVIAAQHTPGPWEWDCGVIPPDGPDRYADIYKDGGELIIATFNDAIPEGRANASLIAAAPDLLAALREISGLIESGEVYGTEINRICHAAITKAEVRHAPR